MCSLFDFIKRRHDFKSGVLCRLTSWKGELHVVLMGRVTVTFSYSSRCLTTEKYTNENSFIENLAASICTVCDTERQTNVIINHKCKFCMFRRRAALSSKSVNRFVSVNCSAQRKRSNGNLVFLFLDKKLCSMLCQKGPDLSDVV